MMINQLIERVLATYPDLSENKNWGEKGLFYNPGDKRRLGAYVLTIKERDGKNDSASNISRRANVYRLNLKISKETFVNLFGSIPKRPAAGGVIATNHDFTELDKIMPHPVYGWMTWICVLNPSLVTIISMEEQGLFKEAYQAAVNTINRSINKSHK